MTIVVRFFLHRLIASKTRIREVASNAEVASSDAKDEIVSFHEVPFGSVCH